MKHALEKSRSFPYIAWAGIIAFSLMTATLSMQLEAEVSALASNRDYIESLIQDGP